MKYFQIFLILIGFAGLIYFGFTSTSYGLTLGMSSEQILETQEIVILGHIESVDLKSDGTQYSVDVLEYVKVPEEFEKKKIINAIGCPQGQRGGCHIFNKGENVLFALNEENGVLQVSEVSFVAPNQNCKVGDFFAFHDAKDGLETVQNNETKKFVTGKPIDITFYAYNKQLDNSPYKVTVEFFRAFNNTVFSKTFEGQFEECVPNVKLETSFTPMEMGKYGKRYTASYGGGEMAWGFPIIEEDAKPLKQFKAGTNVNEIQCNNNLVLIQKYDESPACVKPESIPKLVERRWAENKIIYLDNPLQQKWTHNTNGEITSIDISKDDSIIAVGTKIADTQKGLLYILNDDGTPLWNQEFDSMISHVSISNNSILVKGFHICGGGGGARAHCDYTADVFDIQGNKKYSITHNNMTSFGALLSPNGNQMVTHTYDVLNYFNIQENKSWKYVPDQSIRQATFLTDSILLVNTDNTGETIALDNDGNNLWNFTTNYPSNYSFATSSNGKYFAVSDYTSPDDGNIYLLDYNGSLLWQANTGNTVLHLEFSGGDSHLLAEINGAFMVYDVQGNLLWKNNIPSDLTISSDASFLLGTTFNQGTGASITMFDGKGNILFNNPTGKDSLSAVFDLASNDDYFVIANDTNQLVMFEVSTNFDKIDYDLTDLRNSDNLHVTIVPKMTGLFDVTIAKGDSIEIPWDVKFDQGFTRSNFDVSIISDSGIESQITPTSPYVTINGKPPGEKIITIHPKADVVTGNYTVKILGRGDTVHNQTGWMTNLDGKTLGTININVILK